MSNKVKEVYRNFQNGMLEIIREGISKIEKDSTINAKELVEAFRHLDEKCQAGHLPDAWRK